ncbi:MAG: DUF1624 domain-containing protein [Clostridia bacterium]|nr:DUF1624 domain-containing protein [Clostridia bacterium]
MTGAKNRINELDFLRGLAIILMIYFHLIYDLREFYDYPFVYSEGINYYVGKCSALLFITLTGISCSFSRSNIKRGLRILLYAFLITFVTYWLFPESYINFGILHFLGVSILLHMYFKKIQPLALFLLGTLTIIVGIIFAKIQVTTGFLFPLGLLTSVYSSLDYYPLFPYFGFFLYGIAFKKVLYPYNQSLIAYPLKNNFISKLGRHSLFIYLVHQPLLLGILYILHSLK